MAKYLFDFDGTMTNPLAEADRVRDIIFTQFVDLSGMQRKRVMQIFDDAERTINVAPWMHGWKIGDRISAYSNEDPFIMNHAVAACLDAWAVDNDPSFRERALPKLGHGYESLSALAQFAFSEMLREMRGTGGSVDAEAIDTIRILVDKKEPVVLVSNSGPERIATVLRERGLAATTHDRDPKALLRVRGWARKFHLGETPRTFKVGQYNVDVSRPAYAEIVKEERPDVAVGDVFSLDLALPLDLGVPKLFLRGRTYTPAWSRQLFLAGPKLQYIPPEESLTKIFG